MKLSLEQLGKIAGVRPNKNMVSVLIGLDAYGYEKLGMNKPHRLAQYTPQLAHESGRFRYDHELWGPTPAQQRYEGRKDLGNYYPGDGYKFRGRGPIQITGRANYRQFTKWVREKFGSDTPDFEDDPGAVNTDSWEGIGPLWFWEVHNLNDLADMGDVKGITRRINGGYNGLHDRQQLYVRTGLVLLDYPNVRGFQRAHGLVDDGIAGPITAAALHKALL